MNLFRRIMAWVLLVGFILLTMNLFIFRLWMTESTLLYTALIAAFFLSGVFKRSYTTGPVGEMEAGPDRAEAYGDSEELPELTEAEEVGEEEPEESRVEDAEESGEEEPEESRVEDQQESGRQYD